MTTLSRSLINGALAVTGAVAAFSFTGSAQALTLTSGSGGTSGDANLTLPALNPTLNFQPPTSPNVASGTGQFATENTNTATVTGGPQSISLTGSPNSYTSPAVSNFLTILRADGLPVIIDLLPGTFTSSVANGNYAYNAFNIPANFNEPTSDGTPGNVIAGFLSVNASSNTSTSGTSQTYQITWNKDINNPPNTRVPEPSAVLGLLALGLTGVLVRRQKG